MPVGVTGTWKITRKILTLQRPEIIVHFGEPLTLPAIPRERRAEALQNNTEEIMSRIAALLPPVRGVYAKHPRLEELLQSQANTQSNLGSAIN